MRAAIPNSPLHRQLFEWAEKAGVLLFPQLWQMTGIRSDVAAATSYFKPDNGGVVVGFVMPVWQLVDGVAGANAQNIRITSLESGGRRVLEGSMMQTDLEEAISAYTDTLIAPIGVMPGDELKLSVDLVIGSSFAPNAVVTLTPQAIGYSFVDAKTGANLTDEASKKALESLLAYCGELHVVGMSKVFNSSKYSDSTSNGEPMLVELITTSRLLDIATIGAGNGIRAADLRIGNLRVFPGKYALVDGAAGQFGQLRPLGGMRMRKGTQILAEVEFDSAVQTTRSVALWGRAKA